MLVSFLFVGYITVACALNITVNTQCNGGGSYNFGPSDNKNCDALQLMVLNTPIVCSNTTTQESITFSGDKNTLSFSVNRGTSFPQDLHCNDIVIPSTIVSQLNGCYCPGFGPNPDYMKSATNFLCAGLINYVCQNKQVYTCSHSNKTN